MTTITCANLSFSEIEAIIFDKDGTLEDSQEFLRHLGQKRARMIDAQIPGIGEPLLMAFGIENNRINPMGLMAVGSRRENEIVAAGYIAETGRGWLESLKIARKAFEEADQVLQKDTSYPLFVGSLEVIEFLAEAGLKLGILSAAPTEDVERFVKTHQLENYIQLRMGVDGNISKPDPSLFIHACEKLGVNPEKALMVGDSIGDIEMAKKAGAAGAIGICWGKEKRLQLTGADVTIASLDEILIRSNPPTS